MEVNAAAGVRHRVRLRAGAKRVGESRENSGATSRAGIHGSGAGRGSQPGSHHRRLGRERGTPGREQPGGVSAHSGEHRSGNSRDRPRPGTRQRPQRQERPRQRRAPEPR